MLVHGGPDSLKTYGNVQYCEIWREGRKGSKAVSFLGLVKLKVSSFTDVLNFSKLDEFECYELGYSFASQYQASSPEVLRKSSAADRIH